MQIIGNDVETSMVLLEKPSHVYLGILSLNPYESIILKVSKKIIQI